MTKSRKARRSRRDRRAVFYEALESRHLLSVTFTDQEPNNALPGQVVSSPGLTGVVDMLGSGSVNSGASDTSDYYQFQAAVTGDLNVTVGYTGGTSNATVTFYDNASAPIGSAVVIDSGNPTASLTVTGVNTASVYKVGIVGNDAQYQLRVWNPDVNDDSTGSPANNNTSGTATNLGPFNGTTISSPNHTISRPDRDYFVFNNVVPGTSPVEIRAVMPAGTGAATGANSPTNLGVRVRDVNGVILATSNGTTTDVDLASFQAANGQPYLIEVYSGSVGQVNKYDLQITQPTATVTGFKYLDVNGDGFQDWGEPGLQGWTIFVDADDDGNLDSGEVSVTTGSDGAYSLILPPGNHVIREVLPTNWSQTYPGSAFGNAHRIAVSASMVLDHIDFGNFQGAVKSGIKFEDLDGDGVKDSGEPGLPGWTINLIGTDLQGASVALTTTTDIDGSYAFSLTPGIYTVYETMPGGWSQSFPQAGTGIVTAPNGTLGYQITLASGQQDTDNHFGNYRNATKSGVKFEDLDGDGIKDAGEPGLQNWTINLTGTSGAGNAVSQTPTTDANGNYSFSVPPGTYTVSEVQQSGWTQSMP
ncbi:MAG: hypothetical protein MUF25_02725, partial [Pirellulaceae bacterium]|nr:hypothetical protein [Pirellulaceae bacterium]